MIKSRHLDSSEAFCWRDNRRVSRAEREIRVLLDQLSGPDVVVRPEVDRD